jgi:hypothetical protein
LRHGRGGASGLREEEKVYEIKKKGGIASLIFTKIMVIHIEGEICYS